MRTWTIPFTLNIPESQRPFDDYFIRQRMAEAVTKPGGAKLLKVVITNKEKASATADFVFTGELTFGRWWGR